MSVREATDIGLGLIAVLASAVFISLGEDIVAGTLAVLGIACMAGTLQGLSPR